MSFSGRTHTASLWTSLYVSLGSGHGRLRRGGFWALLGRLVVRVGGLAETGRVGSFNGSKDRNSKSSNSVSWMCNPETQQTGPADHQQSQRSDAARHQLSDTTTSFSASRSLGESLSASVRGLYSRYPRLKGRGQQRAPCVRLCVLTCISKRSNQITPTFPQKIWNHQLWVLLRDDADPRLNVD